jgi:hypothetical protein
MQKQVRGINCDRLFNLFMRIIRALQGIEGDTGREILNALIKELGRGGDNSPLSSEKIVQPDGHL